ncbi:hypothetical protein WJ970_21120 [Achromobacter xylosoxidans]
MAGGKLRVEGAGLNGVNLSRVDLMARTLEINAGIWADQLHVIPPARPRSTTRRRGIGGPGRRPGADGGAGHGGAGRHVCQ